MHKLIFNFRTVFGFHSFTFISDLYMTYGEIRRSNGSTYLTFLLSFDLMYQIQIQMTAPLKLTYAEKLHKLESLYSKLLVS